MKIIHVQKLAAVRLLLHLLSLAISLAFGASCRLVETSCATGDFTCDPALALLGRITGLTLAAGVAAQSRLADTGQTQCYNATVAQACGDPLFPGQDGDYVNVPRAPAFTGPSAHSVYTTDHATSYGALGQVWKTCLEGTSGASCATGSLTDNLSYAAGGTLCSNLNSANAGAGYFGRTNWRLPTYAELVSVTNFSSTSLALDAGAFPNNNVSYVWASTAAAAAPGSHWQWGWVGFTYMTADGDTSGGNNTWCMSSETTLSYGPRLDNGDGTVTDQATLLKWQKCTAGYTNVLACTGGAVSTKTWQQALQYCDALSLGSSGNKWRLPSQAELFSILNTAGSNPAIDTAAFPNTVLGNYWASTTDAGAAGNAWVVSFTAGNMLTGTSKGSALNVRCVSGP